MGERRPLDDVGIRMDLAYAPVHGGFLGPRNLGGGLVQGLSRPRGSDYGLDRKDSALEILRQRYALGEITREEYQEMRGDLI